MLILKITQFFHCIFLPDLFRQLLYFVRKEQSMSKIAQKSRKNSYARARKCSFGKLRFDSEGKNVDSDGPSYAECTAHRDV